jgi:hypothetical protein
MNACPYCGAEEEIEIEEVWPEPRDFNLTLCTLSTPNQRRGSTTHRIRLPQDNMLLLCLRQQLL